MENSGPFLSMNLFWDKLAEWSCFVFGSDDKRGPRGPLKHLVKEVEKELLPVIESGQNGTERGDLEEYADLVFLVFDATRRAGFTYKQLLQMCFEKLEKNRKREWPTPTTDEPVEHIRDE